MITSYFDIEINYIYILLRFLTKFSLLQCVQVCLNECYVVILTE